MHILLAPAKIGAGMFAAESHTSRHHTAIAAMARPARRIGRPWQRSQCDDGWCGTRQQTYPLRSSREPIEYAPENALVAALISLARSMQEQREIAWATPTIRYKSFCQSVKGRIGLQPPFRFFKSAGSILQIDSMILRSESDLASRHLKQSEFRNVDAMQ